MNDDAEQAVDWDAVEISLEKFVHYSMHPTHTASNGKWLAFADIGFALSTDEARLDAARAVVQQMRASLPPVPPPPLARLSDHGRRYKTSHPIQGPNGRWGTLFVVWQVAPATRTPVLVTNYLRVHKLGRSP